MKDNFYLVVYDIADPLRLRRVARLMLHFGLRVQKSVFECNIMPVRLRELIDEAGELIDPECDGIRIYPIPQRSAEKTTLLGFGPPVSLGDEALVV